MKSGNRSGNAAGERHRGSTCSVVIGDGFGRNADLLLTSVEAILDMTGLLRRV